MKKIVTMILALMMVLTLCACGSKPAETQKLIVGFDAEFPPFGFIAADGNYDGFDLALAKEVCTRLGWEFEAVPIDWNTRPLTFKTMSVTSSTTPLALVNSCWTPSMRTLVAATPGREFKSTRRRELPSV